MEICRNLAMTRWEMENFALPEGFSPAFLAWEQDLAGLPDGLPPESLLVVSDREAPPSPERLTAAVEKCACAGVLLDFQKPGQEAAVKALAAGLPCPVAVSERYGAMTDGPVFLSPCPPDKPLEAHLAPWKKRELWLDTFPEVLTLTVTEAGCAAASSPQPPPGPHFTDENLCCRYRAEVFPDSIRFTLWRDRPMLEAHIRQAESMGVTQVIGLFQEWDRA